MAPSIRLATLAILSSALLACDETVAPAPPRAVTFDAVKGGVVEARLGGSQADRQPVLTFTITRVYAGQQPTKAAPFHQDGGDWVYFDAALDREPKVTFTVGTLGRRSDGRVAFGKAVISVTSHEAGSGFVDAFARAFGLKSPAAAAKGTLEPLMLATAELGSGLGREAGGGFSNGGTWTATKWFASLDGEEGEVFFDYDLTGKRGEFAQKDPGYDADVLAVFAAALRDGAPPARTPQNDPTLALSGPSFVDLQPVGSRRAQTQHFGATSLLLTERRTGGDLLISIELASGKATELARVEKSIDRVVCPGSNPTRCLLRETIPSEPGAFSSTDPSRYWVLEGGKLAALAFGTRARHDLTRAPLSPDGRYVAVRTWLDRSSQPGAFAFVEILDRQTGKTQQIRDGEQSFDVVGWQTGLGVAEIERGFSFDPPEQRGALDFELATAQLTPVKRALRTSEEDEPPTPRSPDGKRTFQLESSTLTVTDLSSKKTRRLELHPADHKWAKPGAFKWVSPQYLSFRGNRLALVDTDTMKLSFPLGADDKSSVEFAPDFKRVLLIGEDRVLRLARVVLPAASPKRAPR